MDERYLMLAARYVELNPVRAKLCRSPWRWRWSSAAAHVAGRSDSLVDVAPLLSRVDDWRAYLAAGLGGEEASLLREHERTGRPLGGSMFLKRLESRLGRILRKKPPGRKPKHKKKQVWCPQINPILFARLSQEYLPQNRGKKRHNSYEKES